MEVEFLKKQTLRPTMWIKDRVVVQKGEVRTVNQRLGERLIELNIAKPIKGEPSNNKAFTPSSNKYSLVAKKAGWKDIVDSEGNVVETKREPQALQRLQELNANV